jgi:hypothetical protein
MFDVSELEDLANQSTRFLSDDTIDDIIKRIITIKRDFSDEFAAWSKLRTRGLKGDDCELYE